LIVNKTKITIRNALNILGIEAPEFIWNSVIVDSVLYIT
jgi:hypothetical protein